MNDDTYAPEPDDGNPALIEAMREGHRAAMRELHATNPSMGHPVAEGYIDGADFLIPGTLEVHRVRTMTVTVGPFPIYFGNVNVAMGLRGHHHTAAVTLEYETPIGEHGYPSFRATNDALRSQLEHLTGVRNTFRDATNEDVAERLFDALHDFRAASWEQYGGTYELVALHLDVEGVWDDIGHDAGVTRYTVRQSPTLPEVSQ